MVKDDIMTMGQKVTMCLSPLGRLRMEAMRQPDLDNFKCSECGGDLMPYEYMVCMVCSVIKLGNTFVEAIAPVVDALAALSTTLELIDAPNEKQVARQRSRDDLSAKRKSQRRGGSDYRRQ